MGKWIRIFKMSLNKGKVSENWIMGGLGSLWGKRSLPIAAKVGILEDLVTLAMLSVFETWVLNVRKGEEWERLI